MERLIRRRRLAKDASFKHANCDEIMHLHTCIHVHACIHLHSYPRNLWEDIDAWRREHGFYTGLIHPPFLLPAVAICNLVPDYMHLVDLGVAHHALGGVLFELIYLPNYFPAHATIGSRLGEVWRRISGQYNSRQSPVQLSNLELTFFCNPQAPHRDFPVLTTRVKAAETRRML